MIYGGSDDLIEICGDIRKEFNVDSNEPNYLAFSDGTLLKVIYDEEGVWRISKLYEGKSIVSHIYTGVPDGVYTSEKVPKGCLCYSDCIELSCELIEWVVLGKEFVRRIDK
jgi:hypothetical protein